MSVISENLGFFFVTVKPPMRAKMNRSALNTDFDTDAECRAALEDLRWPDGVRCLRCQSESISRISTRNQYDCDSCRYRFSVTTGTVFHDSHLPLPKWFLATLLMCEAKKGISANQIKRTLGVAHKTAWYLCHRIRQAMTEVSPKGLEGTVEMDETYIGGKRKDVGRGYKRNKTIVVGAVQRQGAIRLRVEKKASQKLLRKFMDDHLSPYTQKLYTDEWPGYQGAADNHVRHETVQHSAEEYVRGDVHTNTIEGAFGLFKRAIVGSFHQVSVKHLDRYLDEFEFRYNNRKNAYLFRDTLTRMVQGEKLSYEQLTA